MQDSQLYDSKNAKNDKETNLLQAPVLCESPVGHDESGDRNKYVTRNGLRSNVEAQPLVDLCCIICTSNNIEEKAAWDLVSTFSSRSAKIPQYNMAIEIRNLTKYPEPKPDLHLKVTHGWIEWMVHIVSDVTAEGPVISTVAENIGKRRGRVAEAMHEKGFQNSFGVMETPIVHGICLHGMVDDMFVFVSEILVDSRVVIEDWIEKQRPQILEEEKRAVRNLWT